MESPEPGCFNYGEAAITPVWKQMTSQEAEVFPSITNKLILRNKAGLGGGRLGRGTLYLKWITTALRMDAALRTTSVLTNIHLR